MPTPTQALSPFQHFDDLLSQYETIEHSWLAWFFFPSALAQELKLYRDSRKAYNKKERAYSDLLFKAYSVQHHLHISTYWFQRWLFPFLSNFKKKIPFFNSSSTFDDNHKEQNPLENTTSEPLVTTPTHSTTSGFQGVDPLSPQVETPHAFSQTQYPTLTTNNTLLSDSSIPTNSTATARPQSESPLEEDLSQPPLVIPSARDALVQPSSTSKGSSNLVSQSHPSSIPATPTLSNSTTTSTFLSPPRTVRITRSSSSEVSPTTTNTALTFLQEFEIESATPKHITGNETSSDDSFNISQDTETENTTTKQALKNSAPYVQTVRARSLTSTSPLDLSPAPPLDLSDDISEAMAVSPAQTSSTSESFSNLLPQSHQASSPSELHTITTSATTTTSLDPNNTTSTFIPSSQNSMGGRVNPQESTANEPTSPTALTTALEIDSTEVANSHTPTEPTISFNHSEVSPTTDTTLTFSEALGVESATPKDTTGDETSSDDSFNISPDTEREKTTTDQALKNSAPCVQTVIARSKANRSTLPLSRAPHLDFGPDISKEIAVSPAQTSSTSEGSSNLLSQSHQASSSSELHTITTSATTTTSLDLNNTTSTFVPSSQNIKEIRINPEESIHNKPVSPTTPTAASETHSTETANSYTPAAPTTPVVHPGVGLTNTPTLLSDSFNVSQKIETEKTLNQAVKSISYVQTVKTLSQTSTLTPPSSSVRDLDLSHDTPTASKNFSPVSQTPTLTTSENQEPSTQETILSTKNTLNSTPELRTPTNQNDYFHKPAKSVHKLSIIGDEGITLFVEAALQSSPSASSARATSVQSSTSSTATASNDERQGIISILEFTQRNRSGISLQESMEVLHVMSNLVSNVEAANMSPTNTEKSPLNPTLSNPPKPECGLSIFTGEGTDIGLTTANSQAPLSTQSSDEAQSAQLQQIQTELSELQTKFSELSPETDLPSEKIRPSVLQDFDIFWTRGELSSSTQSVASRKSSIISTSAEVSSGLFSHPKTTPLDSSLIPDASAFPQNASDELKTETSVLPPTPTRNSNP